MQATLHRYNLGFMELMHAQFENVARLKGGGEKEGGEDGEPLGCTPRRKTNALCTLKCSVHSKKYM